MIARGRSQPPVQQQQRQAWHDRQLRHIMAQFGYDDLQGNFLYLDRGTSESFKGIGLKQIIRAAKLPIRIRTVKKAEKHSNLKREMGKKAYLKRAATPRPYLIG
ncbi:hypothetical protein Lal_00038475 [Lupinus albus]|nr:hypothetical protein Lal_00038475 [Lupinus albus]